jgi:hypothetical protein
MLIQKLVAALLRDSLIDGTLNWDVTMYTALAIVLIAALACRSGDVTKAKLDTQLLPYLCRANTRNAVVLEKYLRQKGAAALKAQGQAVPAIDPSDPDEYDMQMIEQHGPPT